MAEIEPFGLRGGTPFFLERLNAVIILTAWYEKCRAMLPSERESRLRRAGKKPVLTTQQAVSLLLGIVPDFGKADAALETLLRPPPIIVRFLEQLDAGAAERGLTPAQVIAWSNANAVGLEQSFRDAVPESDVANAGALPTTPSPRAAYYAARNAEILTRAQAIVKEYTDALKPLKDSTIGELLSHEFGLKPTTILRLLVNELDLKKQRAFVAREARKIRQKTGF